MSRWRSWSRYSKASCKESRDAEVCCQSVDDVYRSALSGALQGGPGRRLYRRGIPVSLRRRQGRHCRRAEGPGPDPGAVQHAPGDWEAGERGLASLPSRESEFRAGVATALAYAEALGCRQLHAMAGLRQAGVSAEQHEATYVANIQYAADQAAKQDVLVLLEPINSRDMPGYFLSTQVQAEALLEKIDRPNVRIQLDFYHCQIMEGSHPHHRPAVGQVQPHSDCLRA
ncbi:TIM barrel protein [Oceanimonas sp. NS1]|nr:TIM barrel protein [Oceanimonas sp. NS1]